MFRSAKKWVNHRSVKSFNFTNQLTHSLSCWPGLPDGDDDPPMMTTMLPSLGSGTVHRIWRRADKYSIQYCILNLRLSCYSRKRILGLLCDQGKKIVTHCSNKLTYKLCGSVLCIRVPWPFCHHDPHCQARISLPLPPILPPF